MYNPQIIEQLKESINNKVEFLLDCVGIDVNNLNCYGSQIRMPCPIHDGNNTTAFCIDTNKGTWSCYTKNCHENQFDLISLFKLLLSKQLDKEISFKQTVEWLSNKLGIEIKDEKFSEEDLLIFKTINSKKKKIRGENKNIKFQPFSIELIKKNFQPSEYFIKRGISPDILKKFYVGFCNNPKKPMYMRSYVPIIEDDKVIGLSGRINFERCEYCGLYHNGNNGCPNENGNVKDYPKWLHYGFSTENILYNQWNAQKYIKESKTVILTESPKDVWKLEECSIFNSLSLMRLTVLKNHIDKLIKFGVSNIILGLDNDDEGRNHTPKNSLKLNNLFNVYTIDHSKMGSAINISDLSCDKIKDLINHPIHL